LWESYLSQAKAQHSSGQIGQRLEAVATLAKAAAIRPTIELRDEAIACLALPDIRWDRVWQPREPGLPDPIVDFDSSLQRYFIYYRPMGRISVRRSQDDRELVSIPENAVAGIRPEPRFSPDGRYLARATEEACEIWDIDMAQLSVTIPVKTHPVGDPFRFSPDGRRLAIADRDGVIAFYEIATGQTTFLPALHSRIWSMEWSPQMDRLASCTTENGEVSVRDVHTGAVLHTLNHPGGVWTLAWNPEGERLATGCSDHNAYVWDAVTGRLIHTLRGNKNVPARVQFDASGYVLATAAWGRTTRFWDPRSGEELLKAPVELRTFTSHTLQWAYRSEDGGLSLGLAELVTSQAFTTIVADDPMPADGSGYIWLSTDGRLAATPGRAGIRLWDLDMRRYVGLATYEDRGEGADFLPDRSGLLTAGGPDQKVLLWALKEEGGTVSFADRTPRVLPIPGGANCLRVTPDGRTVLVGGGDGTLWAVDLADPSQRRVLGRHPSVRHLSLSPDGRLLATGGGSTDVHVWDWLNGELVHTISIPTWASVAFSPDGRWLVTSGIERGLWDVRSWEPVARFQDPPSTSHFGQFVFSPDSKLMVVRVAPDTIELIDMEHLEPIAHLRCPTPITLNALAFTPDGSRLIFPNETPGHLLHVWDLRVLRRQLAEIGLDW
jgi:WD40 repeat protein